MAHSYPEPRKTRYGVLLIGVGIALCAFALGWLAHVLAAPSDSETGSTRTPTAQPATPSQQANVAGPHDDLLARCQQVYAAQEAPLSTGAAAMSQWSEHVRAMNKLVAGTIDLGQATAYWNRTRVGAHTRLRAYADAASRYDTRTVRCPHAAAQQGGTASACARAVAARNRELATLRPALGTWHIHVRHMEMLRRGEMSPNRAIALWLKTWRQGQFEVRAYRAAARAADGLLC